MNRFRLYNRYSPAYIPQHPAGQPERWFIFHKDQILTRLTEQGTEIPEDSALDLVGGAPVMPHYLGTLDQHACYCMSIETETVGELPEGYQFSSLRALALEVDKEIFRLAGRAYQILHWDLQNRFCGRCGAPTRMKEDERAKQCDICGNIIYPRISPAVIIAILKGDKILLAHNKNFRGNMHSLIAGFMEPGEEFEDTAEREIFEEVGIRVKNIRYFASQPWPFPDSLMIGLIGEYEGGEINVDGQEIEKPADWYDRDHLPEIPNTTSIAGRIIRWFLDNPPIGTDAGIVPK